MDVRTTPVDGLTNTLTLKVRRFRNTNKVGWEREREMDKTQHAHTHTDVRHALTDCIIIIIATDGKRGCLISSSGSGGRHTTWHNTHTHKL